MYLGIDIGGTASRWVLLDGKGMMIDRGVSDGASGLIYDAASLARFVGALETISSVLSCKIAYAQLGITGAGFARHLQIEEQVSRIFDIPLENFSYCNDTSLAWHAVFSERLGHLVSSGTGSVGMTFDANGKRTTIGGRGILVDDAGSGVWIALRALDLLFRNIEENDSTKGVEILASTIFSVLGGRNHDAIRAFVYGQDRGQIGRLAVAVAEAAREGDAIALKLLKQAGQELARLARIMLTRCGNHPVAFIGGVLSLDPIIRKSIETELVGYKLEFPRIDAAQRAAQMAYEKRKN